MKHKFLFTFLSFCFGCVIGVLMFVDYSPDIKGVSGEQIFYTLLSCLIFRLYKEPISDVLAVFVGLLATSEVFFMLGYQLLFIVTNIVIFVLLIMALRMIYFKIIPMIKFRRSK